MEESPNTAVADGSNPAPTTTTTTTVTPTPSTAASVPAGHTIIREGDCSVLYGENEKVFYNKVQVMNRDTSIQCIKAYVQMLKEEAVTKSATKQAKLKRKKAHIQSQIAALETSAASAESAKELAIHKKRLVQCEGELGTNSDGEFPGIRVLEALSATGLRSIRYAQEIPEINTILANDILPKAYECISRNIKFNNLDPSRVIASNANAVDLMVGSRKEEDQFDVIDLDPYGAPTIFLDSDVQVWLGFLFDCCNRRYSEVVHFADMYVDTQAVKSGGLLLVTCTDMADLCGNTPETAWAKYGSLAMKSKFCKEVALRTILSSLASHAARYGRLIEPLVSMSLDFYSTFCCVTLIDRVESSVDTMWLRTVRVVVRVKESRGGVKQMPTKLVRSLTTGL